MEICVCKYSAEFSFKEALIAFTDYITLCRIFTITCLCKIFKNEESNSLRNVDPFLSTS